MVVIPPPPTPGSLITSVRTLWIFPLAIAKVAVPQS
jgi:hypothetical protein